MQSTSRAATPSAALYRASLPFAQRLQPLQGGVGVALSSALSDRRVWANSRLLAWVLLPDGWQGLVQAGPLENPDLRLACARDAGTRTWFRLGGEGPLWAYGAHVSSMGGNAQPREAARELVGAPVRAGLVRRLGDYPFWDAVWLGTSAGVAAPRSPETTT